MKAGPVLVADEDEIHEQVGPPAGGRRDETVLDAQQSYPELIQIDTAQPLRVAELLFDR